MFVLRQINSKITTTFVFYVNAVFDAVFSNQCVCDRKWIGVFSENRFRRYDKV